MNNNLFNAKNCQDIINGYDKTIAKLANMKAGAIRSTKGKLVETITRHLVTMAWDGTGNKKDNLSLKKETIKIPIQDSYVDKIKSNEVKDYIKNNINGFFYRAKSDIHVSINNKLKLAIECKAYTENAMLKRILVDFTLLKKVFPDAHFLLLQLESQLGGDYSANNKIKFGSPSTHTLLSYFDIDLHIITLLTGERKINEEIHKKKFYKELQLDSLKDAVAIIKDLLK